MLAFKRRRSTECQRSIETFIEVFRTEKKGESEAGGKVKHEEMELYFFIRSPSVTAILSGTKNKESKSMALDRYCYLMQTPLFPVFYLVPTTEQTSCTSDEEMKCKEEKDSEGVR